MVKAKGPDFGGVTVLDRGTTKDGKWVIFQYADFIVRAYKKLHKVTIAREYTPDREVLTFNQFALTYGVSVEKLFETVEN